MRERRCEQEASVTDDTHASAAPKTVDADELWLHVAVRYQKAPEHDVAHLKTTFRILFCETPHPA